MQNPPYEQLSPPAALNDTIECFWRLLLPIVTAPDEIISAEGRAEILFQFQGKSEIISTNSEQPFDCATSWLMRPFARSLHVRQVGVSSSAMIGVRFTAGGWAAFRHNDTTNKQSYSFMPLSDFYPSGEVLLLQEQLFNALLTPQWAHPLIAFFMRRKIEAIHFDRVIYAVNQLERRQRSVTALADEVNLSERQFGRVFRQLVGLSPKQFSRITRLNRVLKSAPYHKHDITLDQLAFRYGYHDAPHLVHEFQDLAGISPLDYFTGDYDLIEQKFRDHDRFLQWEPDTMNLLTNS